MIHVACCIDSNYTAHCAVTLISLFENNKKNKICVHLVAPSLSEEDQEKYRKMTEKYNNDIVFYFPPADTLDGFTVIGSKRRFTSATYYRCVITDILPADIDKVLYLDSDIVVMDDISEFWETDIEQYGVAAIEASYAYKDDMYSRLQYDKKYSYFNAGVLIINMNYWREHNIGAQCKEYHAKYLERIKADDQDILNAIFYKDKTLVPMKWNMQEGFYRHRMIERVKDLTAWKKMLLSPSILHFTIKKPWWYDCFHPLRDEYFKYLALTPWKDHRPWESPKNRIARFFKKLTYTLKLRKPRFMKLD